MSLFGREILRGFFLRWVRLPPRAPYFANTYGGLSQTVSDTNPRAFTLTLPGRSSQLVDLVCAAPLGKFKQVALPKIAQDFFGPFLVR